MLLIKGYKMIRYFLIGLFFVPILHSSAQSKVDSLELELTTLKGTEHTDLLIKIGFSLFYKDPSKARYFADLAIEEGRELNYPFGEISGIYIRGILYDISNQPDSSSLYFNKGLDLSRQHQHKYLIGSGLNNLGMMHWNLAHFDEALAYFLEALQIYESDQNDKGIAKASSNIGLIYQELKQYEQALRYNYRALTIRLLEQNQDAIARSYNNLGICMRNLDRQDSAIQYFNLGLEYAIKSEITNVQKAIYDNLANTYYDLQEYENAIKHHLLSLKLSQDDPVGQISPQTNLSATYFKIKNYKEALRMAFIADSVMRKHHLPKRSIDNYFNLANAYLANGILDSAIRNYERWRILTDEIHGEASAKAVAEMQAKYETEKNEQRVAFLEKEQEVKELELAQSQTIILLIGSLSIFLVISILLYNSRKRYKLKESLAQEKEELQRTRFRAVIDAEEKERKRIAQELHDGLGQLLSTARITISTVGESGNQKVINALSLIDESIGEVRSISHNLMPNALTSVGLKSALEGLAHTINDSGHVKINLQLHGDLYFDELKTISIYRIIQEVVNNALKYSGSPNISIKVGTLAGKIILEVSDQGKGFDTTLIRQSTGIGWSSIYSRVDLLEGTITIYSKLNEGTHVKIEIPDDRTYNQAAVS